MKPARTRVTGYSLIELSLTLGIMTVLFSMALPSLADLNQETRRTSAVNLLAADLNHARMQAISRGRMVVVCPSNDGWTCIDSDNWSGGWLSFVDDNDNREVDPGDTILRYTQGGQAGLYVSGNPGRTRIRFQPSGGTYGSNSSWTMCSANSTGNERGLVLSNAGRVRSTRSPTSAAIRRCQSLAGIQG